MRKAIFPLIFTTLAMFACNNAQSSSENGAPGESPLPDSSSAQVSGFENKPGQDTPPNPSPEKAVAVSVKEVPGVPAGTKARVQPAANQNAQPAPAIQPKDSAATQPEQIEVTTGPPASAEEEKPGLPSPPSHDAFDKLLQQYVSASGKVNYSGLKKDKAKLEAYLEVLKKNPPQASWPKGEQMAFWINAYNGFTIKLIVDNYPIPSITKLDGGKPWDVKRINIGGKNYSLNNIENDILRPQFKDARIHFAVNCAAKSCPPLLNRAWTAANLEGNFEKQAKAFINNPQFNKIGAKEAQVSNIFEWYAADFGNLPGFLNKYANTKISPNAKVSYLEYDWALNE